MPLDPRAFGPVTRGMQPAAPRPMAGGLSRLVRPTAIPTAADEPDTPTSPALPWQSPEAFQPISGEDDTAPKAGGAGGLTPLSQLPGYQSFEPPEMEMEGAGDAGGGDTFSGPGPSTTPKAPKAPTFGGLTQPDTSTADALRFAKMGISGAKHLAGLGGALTEGGLSSGLGAAASGLGALGGLFSIGTGLASGTPGGYAQAGFAAPGTVSSLSSLSGQLGGPTISSLLGGGTAAGGGAAGAAGGAVALGADAGLVAGAAGGGAAAGGAAASGGAAGGAMALAPAIAGAASFYAAPLAVAAIAVANYYKKEAEKEYRQTVGGAHIRQGYVDAIPNIQTALMATQNLGFVNQLPPEQQAQALQDVKAVLERGWRDLTNVSTLISTKGLGGKSAKGAPADTTQAEQLAKVAVPALGGALLRVYDALAQRGVAVQGATGLDSASDPAQLLNALGSHAGLDQTANQQRIQGGGLAGLLGQIGPGNLERGVTGYFGEQNAEYGASPFSQYLSQIPTINTPQGLTPERLQMLVGTQTSARQGALGQLMQGEGNETYAAPYQAGGLRGLMQQRSGAAPEEVDQAMATYGNTPSSILTYLRGLQQQRAASAAYQTGAQYGG